ncbi:MAG: cupin domain-containing protein [Clostridia bacterium]|jgi:quercetin dioxygenase-like cupin family protein|nr:cupin domain-containing protein [Clostridia bacterium]MBT7122140.1 cupin domain-containing protein [Clostridia bacterium]
MIEKDYKYTLADTKTIEKLVADGNVHINHMILPKGDCLPLHMSNSNVYMTVMRGVISLILDDQERRDYGVGNILNIPNNTKMNVSNTNDTVAEILVVKAPAPRG